MSDTVDYKKLEEDLYKKYGLEYTCIECQYDDPMHMHFVHIPTVGQDGFYWEVGALEGFRHYELRHFEGGIYDPAALKLVPKRFMMKRRMDFEFDWAIHSNRPDNPYLKLPTTTHPNIWAFFRAVGFDHKRRRYLKDGEDFHPEARWPDKTKKRKVSK